MEDWHLAKKAETAKNEIERVMDDLCDKITELENDLGFYQRKVKELEQEIEELKNK